MIPRTEPQITHSRSLSLDQIDAPPLLRPASPLRNLDAAPIHPQRSVSFNHLFSNMRQVRHELFQHDPIADSGLSRLIPRLPSRSHASEALMPTEQEYTAMTELSAALASIDHCQKIGFADSTTGAHCAMNENYDALFMIKSNDECFFEFIGNNIAEKLELNIPGFALIDHTTVGYPSLKEKLSSTNTYPCMLSEYREAVNLKEVNYNSPLDPIESCKSLGKAFILDLMIGNWDRFPIFPGDDQGNYGNLMYEASTQQLLFIDIVAMKHTEHGGYQNQDYLHLTDKKTSEALHKIIAWLHPKFPQLKVSEETKLAFRQGIEEAIDCLSKHESFFIEMFHDLKTHLQSQTQMYQQETIPTLLERLKEYAAETTTSTTDPVSEKTLMATLHELISQIITDPKAAERMRERIIKGGLPQIGPLKHHADTLKKDAVFNKTWKQYAQVTAKQRKQQAEHQLLDQLKNPAQIIHQLDIFLEALDKTDLKKTDMGQQLIMIHAEIENLNENIKKLDMMTDSFSSIESKLKPAS
jgi:hypothetical protein